jgi:Secretion system C-terminal sorting domain
MKSKTTLLSLFLLMILFSKAQQNVFSYMYYDPNRAVQANAVVKAFDNGFILAGTYDYKPAAIKIDSAGNIIWNKIIGVNYIYGNLAVGFYCITRTTDSCYILAGVVYDSITQLNNMVGVKINAIGDTLWCRKFATNDIPQSIQQTYDHGYIIAGTIQGSSSDAMVMKIDSVGNLLWRKSLITSNYYNTCSVKQTIDSGYVLATTLTNSTTNWNYAGLIKLTSSGNPLWTKIYSSGSPSHMVCNDISIDSSSILYYTMDEGNLFLMKMDYTGNVISAISYSGGCGQGGGMYNLKNPTNHLRQTSDKGYLISNGCYSNNILIKLDSAMNIKWATNVGATGTDALETNEHGYFTVGNGPIFGVKYQTSIPHFGIATLDSLGQGGLCVNTNYSSSQPSVITDSISTSSFSSGGSSQKLFPFVYSTPINKDTGCVNIFGGIKEYSDFGDITLSPNPFTTATIITSSKEQKNTSLLIYDLTGRIVKKTTINKATKATIEKGEMQPGIYFVEFINDKNQYINKKLIVQ